MSLYDIHMERQEDLKLIHARALEETQAQHAVPDNLKCIQRIQLQDDAGESYLAELSVLRRGYKIQWTAQTKMYELLNIQNNEYYKWVNNTIIDRFLKNGFLRSCDELQIYRNKAEVKRLNTKLQKANSDRNDSLIVHWRQRRVDLIEKITAIEEAL